MFISHAQNFEDVILMRALKDVQKGFYIDIGAQDPVADSVSLAFYNKGWRGIHVEPNPFYAAKLRSARPDEEVVEAVVGPGSGDSVFYIVGKTGLSTGRPDIVRTYDKSDIHEISVPIISLARILNGVSGDVQWLKIDVEGMEAAVLESWKGSDIRPWIIVIESTLPNSQKPAHEAWEGMLLSRGYSPVYFDGVNKFYVHKRRAELQSVFGPGPNCFDDFRLDVSSGYIDKRQVVKLEQEHQGAIKRIENRARELTSEIATKNDHLAQYEQNVQRQSEQLIQFEQELLRKNEHLIRYENDIKTQQEQISAFASREDHHRHETSALNASFGQAANTWATASATLADQIAQQNDQLIRGDQELSLKNDQLAKSALDIAQLQESLAAVATREDGLRNDLAHINDELVKYEAVISELQDHAASAASRETDLRSDLERKDDELARLGAAVSELEDHAARSAAHADHLQQQLAHGEWHRAEVASREANLSVQLAALEQYIRDVRASTSWQITTPVRAIRIAGQWLKRGTKAWLTFKPGSRPRRMARRGAAGLFDFIRRRPTLFTLAKRTLALAPPLHRRLRERFDPMKPFAATIVPPPWSGPAEHIPLPYDEKLVYERLTQAVKFAGETSEIDPRTDNARPRLAYVSPLPPEKSGIADFSAQFLPSLSEYYQIDVISPQPTVADPWVIANCGIRDVAWFEQNAHVYDRVLYHFGNSPFHSHMFPLLEKIPGVVALHDFFLGSILGHLELYGGWGDYWTKALGHSHGYPALISRLTPNNVPKAVENYPANFPVLDKAPGIIVHSQHARSLCATFYPAYNADNWAVLPLAKAPNLRSEEKSARSGLGLTEDAFVICSFGFVQETKLSRSLLDAWLTSPLAADPNCHLIFVGDAAKGHYTEELERIIASSRASDRIKITGFASPDIYEAYLQSADVAVQLRTQSRGETSAAVLDCLAHGIPTIINANGSMDEISKKAVICLPDIYNEDQLVKALTDLWKSKTLRVSIGQQARAFVAERHAPDQVAKKYFDAIEGFTSAAPVVDSLPSLIRYARDNALEMADPDSILSHARKLRRSAPISRPAKKMLVDVSVLVREDYRTGIQRVVRAQLIELFKSPPPGYRIEPVWLNNDFGEWRYFYARRYGLELLGFPQAVVADDPVDVGEGDIFFGADFFATGVIGAARVGLCDEWRARGVRICFSVYDILPLTLPQCFPASAETIHRSWLTTIARSADTLICISGTVAIKTRAWLSSNTSDQPSVVSCALGADIDASSPTVGLPADADTVLKTISSRDSFLMVGTIEPRKGHLQALDAFEKLWLDGLDVQLIIVGARGWKGLPDEEARTIPTIIRRLETHPEQGNRLIWLDGASDEYIEKIYASSRCLIAASEDEGFGLPLIEAARHNLPILAHDIAVFREVAGDHATYFKGRNGDDLAKAVRSWLALRAAGSCPESGKMRWLTWKENVERLKEILLTTTPAPRGARDEITHLRSAQRA